MKYQDGDVLFTQAQDNGFIAKQIRWWTRTWGEEKTKASHVAVVIQYGKIKIVEQTFPEQIISPIDKYENIIIYRYRNLSERERCLIKHTAQCGVGERYSIGNIVRFLISAVFWKVVTLPFYMVHCFLDLFRPNRKSWKGLELSLLQFLLPSKNLVCSQTVAKYYWDIGIHIGGDWRSATPDRMLDHMENHEEWELVE